MKTSLNQRDRSVWGARGVVNATQWCFTRFDLLLHRVTDRSLGAAVARAPHLLLITTGRRTGKTRRTPLVYVPDGVTFLVVAAYGGAPWNPHWLANVSSFWRATIVVEHRRIDVEAQVVEGERRADLWPMMCEQITSLRDAQARTDRQIPLVRLTPIGQPQNPVASERPESDDFDENMVGKCGEHLDIGTISSDNGRVRLGDRNHECVDR